MRRRYLETAGDAGNHTGGRRATAAVAHEKGRMMAAAIDMMVTSEERRRESLGQAGDCGTALTKTGKVRGNTRRSSWPVRSTAGNRLPIHKKNVTGQVNQLGQRKGEYVSNNG
jgi:hypothetical protein